MERQDKIEVTTIGLHRPFNMPLKSLVWVCRFSKSYVQRSGHNFYLDFFLWMLKSIDVHADTFNEQYAEGIIRPKNARNILSQFSCCSYSEISERVRSTLSARATDGDKIIYSSYKNTSYYISLAKKVYLIDVRYKLNLAGEDLAKVRDYRFFDLSDKHRLLLFRALTRDFFEILIVIAQSLRLNKDDRALADSFFRAYLKRSESEGNIRYITSFDKNYLEVLHHWVDELKLCTTTGTVRKNYLTEIDNLGLTSQYEAIVHNTKTFFTDEFKNIVKLELQYDKIRSTYLMLLKVRKSEFGFVNLYDIKKSFRLSYEKFNELLNSYYTAYRHVEIILFSNTVSSIDMRRRFFVAGNAVLNIRIIKKS